MKELNSMKRMLILISLGFIAYSCNKSIQLYLSGISIDQRKDLKGEAVELAQKILLDDCKKDRNRIKNWDGSLSEPGKQYGNYEIDSLDIIPILLFGVSKKANEYNGSNIIDYLEYNKKEILGFYTFKDGHFHGLLDWSDVHHYNLQKVCSYFTIENSYFTITDSYWTGLKYLKDNGKDISFLFGVKYFLETLWFIDNDEIFVLNLKDMKIYEPDEFIKKICDEAYIHDLANGVNMVCNY